jgi:hypothetical protein
VEFESWLLILPVFADESLTFHSQPKQPFVALALVCIPHVTRRNVANTGKQMLEYVYVVAPATPQ